MYQFIAFVLGGTRLNNIILSLLTKLINFRKYGVILVIFLEEFGQRIVSRNKKRFKKFYPRRKYDLLKVLVILYLTSPHL